MTLQVGDQLRLQPHDWSDLAEAVAHHESGPVFVLGAIPGEEVVAEVLATGPRATSARAMSVPTPSPDRVKAPCPYYGDCTGCALQHVDYARQLAFKRARVERAYAAEGLSPSVTAPLPAPSLWHYRNHARFTVNKHGALGFVNRVTRRFVRVDHCRLMDGRINETLEALQERAAETSQLSVRSGTQSGDRLVQPPLTNEAVPLSTGQKHLYEHVGGRAFRISSPCFFQVNTAQAERMVAWTRDALGLTGAEDLVDAYAGVGLFAVLLAPHARRVTALESAGPAVEDARENAADCPNIALQTARTEDGLAALTSRPDALILDPPRRGCHRRALEHAVRLLPRRIAYVACDPEALARDTRQLVNGPYRLEQVQPIDLFPHTRHIETLALLTLEPSPPPLVLASRSPRRQDLLAQEGFSFELEPADTIEAGDADETPRDTARRLALEKARAVAARRGKGTVLGADTVVALDDTALGKPADRAEAERMLRALRGRDHVVYTGVAVADPEKGREATAVRRTTVTMRPYSDEQMKAHIARGEADDKAGGYAIQDEHFAPVAALSGCHSNVVGLPMCAVTALLRRVGFDPDGHAPLSQPSACPDCVPAHVKTKTSWHVRPPQ